MSEVSLEILAILVLIIANGVFAMSEIAVVSSRKARLQQQAEEGRKSAAVALALAREPNDFLSTVQIGITLIGTLAGAFGGATLAEELAVYLNTFPALAPHGQSIGIGVVVVAISYASLIIGELVPKRLALSNPERFASALAPVMRLIARVASPAVRFLSLSTGLVLRILPFRNVEASVVTPEEIKLMIEQATKAGTFEAGEQEMVDGVLQLTDRRAVELMQPRMNIVWLDINADPEAFRRRIGESSHSRLLVCKGSLDKVAGYVHMKDLLGSCLEGRPLDLKPSLRPLPAVPESMRALRVLEQFQRSGTHIAAVVNEHGGVEGLITLHDVMEAILGDLPEVGEEAKPGASRRPDGSWLVDGMMPVYEFKDLLEIKELEGEEEGLFTTLGGFVMAQLGRIPSPADHFDSGGKRYEVVDMDGNRVDKVQITDLHGVENEE